MSKRMNLTLVLATTVMVLGAVLAIAGSSSDRLRRKVKRANRAALASANYVDGLQKHRFRITAQTLRAWLSGPTPPVVVDVRAGAPYEAGHIAGALLRPAAALLQGKAKLTAKGRQVVIYDQDGRLTPFLVHPVRASGVDAYILAGGYAAWMAPSARRQAARRAAGQKKKGGGYARPAPRPAPAASAPPPAAAPPPMGAPPSASMAASSSPPADEGC